MRSPFRALGVGLVTGVFLFAAVPAFAAQTSNADIVIIQPDDVLADDLYAGAVRIIVQGEIDGDLIAIAAEEVVIEGTVTGSVFALAPRVSVSGTVGRSLRVNGNDLVVDGAVGNDVVAVVLDLDLGESSSIGGDVLAWAWNMDALGQIGEDLKGGMRVLNLAGSVGGDVDVSVDRLTIVDDLTVGGDLGYRSNREATGLENATVAGTVVHKTPLPPNIRVRALGVFARFLVVLFLTVAALTVAYGWPKRTAAAIEKVGHSPWRAWASGASVVFLPVLLVGVTALIVGLAPAEAAFPLLAILGPLVIAAVGLVVALSLVAGAPVVGRLGSLVFRKLELYGSVLAGALLIGLIWLLPIIGWLVPLIVLPLGLGAWFLSWRDSSPVTAEEELEETGAGSGPPPTGA